MYPQNFFSLFPPFPRNNKVFVAMSFDKKFDSRWENVIAPIIREVQINGVSLNPYRVDVSRISDSILTDILEGIRSSLLILADITAIGNIDGKPVRNGNVMYEIGIAQAIRLPEEVVLFRSDKDEILFDLANIREDFDLPLFLSHSLYTLGVYSDVFGGFSKSSRVNFYDPDRDPIKASTILGKSLIGALSEIDHKKSLAVKHAAESLDFDCWQLLIQAGASPTKTVDQPVIRTMRDVMSKTRVLMAISRLLELGLLTAQFIELTKTTLESLDLDAQAEKILKYRITPFGEAVVEQIAEKMGLPTLKDANELKDFMSNHMLE